MNEGIRTLSEVNGVVDSDLAKMINDKWSEVSRAVYLGFRVEKKVKNMTILISNRVGLRERRDMYTLYGHLLDPLHKRIQR
jgi:hypothetical protein